MASFDFQALAARAVQDRPDALLLDGLEDIGATSRRLRKATRVADRAAAAQAWRDAVEMVAAAKPQTAEGLLGKLQMVEARMQAQGKKYEAPDPLGLPLIVIRDAIAWLSPSVAPPARRRRCALKRVAR